MSSCFDLASSNAQDIRRQMEDAGVDYVEGLASFTDGGDTSTLSVSNKGKGKADDESAAVETVQVSASNILIATGSTPFRQGGIPFDANRVFDSDSINQVRFLTLPYRTLAPRSCQEQTMMMNWREKGNKEKRKNKHSWFHIYSPDFFKMTDSHDSLNERIHPSSPCFLLIDSACRFSWDFCPSRLPLREVESLPSNLPESFGT
jgi:hypothetical protein